jgi:alkanesulfonate monooxygenase SsuD/methylene tetrahydromethanopterin reductase-like flavin-dependent oxidoreductase (luciferase family)
MSEVEEVKFGYEPPCYPWELIYELALYCDKSGLYDSLWLPDHLAAFGIRRWDALEAWSMASAIAVATKRIKIGTGVSDTYRHHPAVLAQMATTCDVISGGRAFLGVGIGEAMNLLPYGINYDRPIGRTREAVTIIKRLLTEERVTFEGEFYRLKDAFIQPKPVRGRLPIYIAANSPRTMKLAAELGDGWVPASMTPKEYEAKLKELRDMVKEVGRSPDEIEPALFIYVVIEKDYNTALRLASLPVKLYLLGRPRMLEAIGYKPPTYDHEVTFKLVMHPDSISKLMEDARQIPDEAVERCAVLIGDPDTIIGKIEDYIRAGVRHFATSFFVTPGRMRETCMYFADAVIRYFKG